MRIIVDLGVIWGPLFVFTWQVQFWELVRSSARKTSKYPCIRNLPKPYELYYSSYGLGRFQIVNILDIGRAILSRVDTGSYSRSFKNEWTQYGPKVIRLLLEGRPSRKHPTYRNNHQPRGAGTCRQNARIWRLFGGYIHNPESPI